MDSTNGIVIGEVIDIEDPEGLARVRVKFPHLNNQTSDWARIATPMAGPDRGIFFRPEVGDEVLVAFLQRDPRWSFVVGALWSKVDRPPDDDGKAKENNWRFIKSRSGSIIKMDDTKDAELIEIKHPNNSRVLIEKELTRVECEQGDIEVIARAGNVKVEASQKVQVTAKTVEVTGETSVKVSAPSISLEGDVVEIVGKTNVKIN